MANELQIFNCEQGSVEWHQCRLGIPTMSEAKTLLTKGRGGGPSKERLTYMRLLAGERLLQASAEPFSTEHTERGHELEQEVCDLYVMLRDVELTEVGFLRRGDVGCSPDRLVGEEGLLEIKTKLPKLQIALLEEREIPDEHIPQLQGQLWVSGRQWVDFASYWPGLPPFIKRVYRDEVFIATLKVAADEFLAELDALVDRIRNYKAAA